MAKRWFVATYRIGLGVAVFVAVIVQFVYGLSTFPDFSPANFISYFTIESNVFAASVLIVSGCLLAGRKRTDNLSLWRGAATLYMTITGIVYVLLLSGLNVQTTLPWVNTLLHYIMPVVMILDWLMDLPKKRIAFKRGLLWLVFPIAYLAYSLVRGHIVSWYPYPFLNPSDDGYLGVAVVSLIIALGALSLTALLVWSTRLLPSKKGA